ncbi:Agamous-like MADS-box protein AGL62 [Capsicum annuum]|uniref:Agamous-like MADS-box protein AGL62 n=1 Tax=Capsicum annuum TaxID=4072 RepID=A0A2G2Y5Q3_CAPAN|nr:Agamous-like MADS-box protein AGL62 [Capsicum annuum]
MAKKPSSMGRQKIKIAKIKVKNHLQVTFSKRRSGLFKKASELCTLCGVEIAIIVFSPARKVFSFGHPNVESLIDRFLSRNNTNNNPIANNSLQLVEAHRNANVCGLNLQLTQILGEVEIEKKRGESLDQMRKTSQSQCWWEAPISQLDLQELEQLKDSMEALKKYETNQASKFMVNEIANSSTFLVLMVDARRRRLNVRAMACLPTWKFGTRLSDLEYLNLCHSQIGTIGRSPG